MGKDAHGEDSLGDQDEPGSDEPGSRDDGPEEADVAEPTEAEFEAAELAARASREAMARMSWRRRTATGAILSGLAFGFQQVFEDKPKDISVIIETSGEPPTDLPVEAELAEMAPRRSVVKIRPWLLRESQEPGNLEAKAAARDEAEGEAEADAAQTDEAKTED